MRSIALLAVSLLVLSSTQARAQENDLLGLWASETTFAPALHGELTLRRTGQSWRASLGGAAAQCTTEADAMRCAFAGIVTLAPTATIFPSRMSTVAFSIGALLTG
jgi:hypothetical protein